MNWQINQQKIIWHEQDKIMKQRAMGSGEWVIALQKRNEAESKAKELREKYSYLPGLLSKDATVMSAFTYAAGTVRSGPMQILVDSNNTIYYSAKCGTCTYTEQVHTQSEVEYWHGKVAKETIGTYPLPVSTFTKMALEASVNKVDVPKIGETRTIIFVHNEENDHKVVSVVVTNEGKVTSWSGWKSYK
ncbi:hypothetical protein AB6A23_01170 [Paenibacillus tarimensis]